MKRGRMLTFCLLVELFALATPTTDSTMNVLFISIDDLRPELGCYGSTVQSPNIDALANKSVLFERAYCQVAQCAPSRASMLTGRRPDTNRIWTIDRNQYWRNPGYTNATTLPQYFKENGYISIGMGKIFHSGAQSGHDDHLYSWSPEGLPYYESPEHATENRNLTSLWWAFEGDTGSELPDGQIASQASKVLQDLKNLRTQGDTRPFFLAVGFHKPHIPFYMPKAFYDLYPPASQIPLPANPDPPIDMPYVAWTGYGTLRQYDNTKNVFTGTRCRKNSEQAISKACGFPDEIAQEIRKSYYACVSYIDSLVGQVLTQLETEGFADNTIVVLTSDHGFHLGEHREWAKNTVCILYAFARSAWGYSVVCIQNFEDATRVPLLVHVPNVTISGSRTNAFVELIDLFPTLTELTGLPVPPTCPTLSNSLLACVEGTSFAAVLAKPSDTWKNATFSQYARPSAGLTDIPGKGTLNRIDGQEQVMGYSIRTAQYRYTEWVKFDATTVTPDWNDLWGMELYDHRTEIGLFNNENRNLASDSTFADVRSELSAALRVGWKASIPTATQVDTSSSPVEATLQPPTAFHATEIHQEHHTRESHQEHHTTESHQEYHTTESHQELFE